jgi:hypothetical protein
MVHTGENFLAAVETTSSIGAQVNLHTLYGDGTVATYTIRACRHRAPCVQRSPVRGCRA